MVFPAPLAPSRPTISPGPTSRLTSRTAVAAPNRRVTATHWARGGAGVPGRPAPGCPVRVASRCGDGAVTGGGEPGWSAVSRASDATVTASWRSGSTGWPGAAASPGGIQVRHRPSRRQLRDRAPAGGGPGQATMEPGSAATISPGVPAASARPASRTSTAAARCASAR